MFFCTDNTRPIVEEQLMRSGYLNTLELIALLHVSRAARCAAVPRLEALENEALATKLHSQMFCDWLHRPRVTMSNEEFQQLVTNDDIAGPLRLAAIEQRAANLASRFVILHQKKTYDQEESTVAVFNAKGAFVSLYHFSCRHGYEEHLTSPEWKPNDDPITDYRVFFSQGATNCEFPDMNLKGNRYPTYSGWNLDYIQVDHQWECGFLGDNAYPHYGIVKSLSGELSPMETIFVLMHALTSDARAIADITFGVLKMFVDNLDVAVFNDELAFGPEEDVEALERLNAEWVEELKSFKYKRDGRTVVKRKRARGRR